MSYILEALKKAQAERQLGNAPTIHAAQPVPALQPDVAASRRPLYVGLGAGALMVVVGAAFLWRAGPAQGPGAQVAQTQAPAGQVASVTAGAPAAGAPALAVAAGSAPVATATAPAAGTLASGLPATGSPAAGSPVSAAPAASSSLEVSAPPEPVRAPQPRVAAAAPRPAPAAARAAAPSAALPATAPAVQVRMPTPAPAAVAAVPARAAGSPAAGSPVAGSPAAAPEDSLPFLQQLPASVQGGIPRVAFGGYMYSANPADRLLLVDKALRHEGEEVAPGLVLEKLLPRAAVMNYRGVRYRVAY